ncbi:ATP-grasp domain-containing protein [Actinophytocola sp.]|uniref:ATP-grasp domain-containing protein n=1 Tax=Actinophytocola sp. TaxID=1872138 RepID=UPI003D6B7129
MNDTLLVLYDHGAASPGDIALGLRELGSVVFAVPDSDHVRELRPILARLGEVISLDDASTRQVSAVLTFSEPLLPAAAELAGALGLPFHSPATTRMLTDKVAQRDRLRARRVDHTRSAAIVSLDQWPAVRDHVRLPAVVKPLRGIGSRDTYLVPDDETALDVLPAVLGAAPVVVEEFLRGKDCAPFGDYVSVESVCFPQGVRHLAITGKFPLVSPFRECGRFWPTTLSDEDSSAVLALTTGALRALEVRTGLTHTEIKLTDQGPRVIEVNGRLGGHTNLLAKQSCGVDLITLAGRLALGATSTDPLPSIDGVHFQVSTPAPVEPFRLNAVHGAADVRRVNGVTGYRSYHRPGNWFAGSVQTRYLDLLWGNAADHHTMIATVDEAMAKLSFDFEFAGGLRRMSATTLRGRNA